MATTDKWHQEIERWAAYITDLRTKHRGDETMIRTASWDSLEQLMECEAGRSYVLRQLDPQSLAVQPQHVFISNRDGVARYEIYSDGSLLCTNNAEDEVHVDFRDFVKDVLIPGLQPGVCWTKEEEAKHGWLIDEMDRHILLLYCGGDDSEARDLIS